MQAQMSISLIRIECLILEFQSERSANMLGMEVVENLESSSLASPGFSNISGNYH